MKPARSILIRALMTASLVAVAAPLVAQPTIVLIGGKKQGMAKGEHDFPDGILKLERLIKTSPDFAKLKPVVKSYPVGFPRNLAEIDDATVVVMYFGPVAGTDGRSASPVQDPAVAAELDKLAKRGVGFVALHQTFTMPSDATGPSPFLALLGATRPSGSDYSIEAAPVSVTETTKQVTRGVEQFDYLDEYYSGITFGNVNPVLGARSHVQFKSGKAAYEEPSRNRTIAWTFNRPDGGRSFSFTGGHYLATLDQPQARTVLLNAILWAAKESVPEAGVQSSIPTASRMGMAPPPEPQIVVYPAENVKVEPQAWGKLEWYAHRSIGNSSNVTIGQATFNPGKGNAPHWHPNCDEVLHVLKGRVINKIGDKEYEMKAGDTMTIPEGVVHSTRNIGTDEAIVAISYNSADRVAIGE